MPSGTSWVALISSGPRAPADALTGVRFPLRGASVAAVALEAGGDNPSP